MAAKVQTIDSHTAGEPTRCVVDGAPDLGTGDLTSKARRFAEECDAFRRSVILEPRGTDWLVGALLLEPTDKGCVADVIFFNNVGVLGMCGHGLIGVVETLRYLGRIEPGQHRFGTPVGEVSATLHDDHRVSIENVPSYRWRKDVCVEVPGLGNVVGDIAYGGNWFFLSKLDAVEWDRLGSLTERATRIRAALDTQNIRGEDDGLIDHIELVGPETPGVADARNFVLCPGGEYDRSPCGTGTSAKLACLAADGDLQEGQLWRQQSICGGVFEGRYAWVDETRHILPTITGRAFVTAETTLVFDAADPYRRGITTV